MMRDIHRWAVETCVPAVVCPRGLDVAHARRFSRRIRRLSQRAPGMALKQLRQWGHEQAKVFTRSSIDIRLNCQSTVWPTSRVLMDAYSLTNSGRHHRYCAQRAT
jgi:hypothetical protein